MKVTRLLTQTHHVGWISLFVKTPVKASSRHAALLQPPVPHLCFGQEPRWIHCGSAINKDNQNYNPLQKFFPKQTKNRSLVMYDDLFAQVANEEKTKATFNKVVDIFIKRDIRRRGHVEFIYAALKKIPEFGLQREVDVYNKLLDVFPKEIFVPQNFIQQMMNHYPRQQECGLQVLEQMEHNGVMPNKQTHILLLQIFGKSSHPMMKCKRTTYWFTKFINIRTFPVPHVLPQDPIDVARLCLPRIANDLNAKMTVYQHPLPDITETGEEITKPYIIGIQSPDQMALLAKHNPNRPVFVEGPFPLWLRNTCVYYYLLRADPVPPEEKVDEGPDPELINSHQSLFYPLSLDLDLTIDIGDDDSFDVDDVENDPVYAMCMVGKGDQATLAQWISGLQETNPILGRIPTVFRVESGPREIQLAADVENGSDSKTEHEHIKDNESMNFQQ